MRKVFILTMFGTPHAWVDQYIQNVAKLGDSGWHWKIFTPHTINNLPKNVQVHPMTLDEFNELVKQKIGLDNGNFLNERGVPDKNMSDYYIANGVIFEDYIKDYEFWGITNWDVVYGQLSNFVTDSELEDCDVFSDDVNTLNGVFCLFRNTPKINHLFERIPDWNGKMMVHQLIATDEYDMTDVLRRSFDIRFVYPAYYPMHSHDRLSHHVPEPQIEMKADGTLWDLFIDIAPPRWIHQRPYIGREIPYFHFCHTKTYPPIK